MFVDTSIFCTFTLSYGPSASFKDIQYFMSLQKMCDTVRWGISSIFIISDNLYHWGNTRRTVTVYEYEWCFLCILLSPNFCPNKTARQLERTVCQCIHVQLTVHLLRQLICFYFKEPVSKKLELDLVSLCLCWK